MRLATFNILHGRALDGGPVSTERLVEACASLDADVLALQEVDRGQPRSGGIDQTAAVAEGMGAAAWRFEPAIVGEPGGRWRPAGDDTEGDGGYGVALVCGRPVRAWHVLRLAPAAMRSPVFVPGRRAFVLLPDEPRVVLAAELDGGANPSVVASTHLSFVPVWNALQLRRATRWLAGLGPSCVLLGDTNLPGALPGLVSGWQSLARARTFPADQPSMQIDHALGHGPLPEVVGVDAPRLALSDHRALVVELAGG
ncbi:MAG TPA: endonuclease/exonuclease/phosphatase family protein [Acidimicrobiales bacterium]|nr:endonuclease/exonuclease/phosphatase family protein [Acidimicrobiales bacterium]